ncbi:MAG: FtsW/RodA/SpoVE family cell cycle protein [Phycisphaeraceae bacterium]|nr:FtsW/RodA/SpoVE family cell cycle protein [Phycisphaerales bacterium]MCB9859010.1 FtsW/RodA/SpoVE family cell cycle protein [Phycisphaeraceae bacterium]
MTIVCAGMIRPGGVIAVLALALLCVGVVMVTSADMRVVSRIPDTPLGLGDVATPEATSVSAPAQIESVGAMLRRIATSSQVMYFVMAITAMLVASLIPINKLLALAGLQSNASDSHPPVETPVLPMPSDFPWHKKTLRIAWRWFKPFLHRDYLLPATAVILICALLVCVYVPGLRSPRNGSNRWILLPGLGGQTFQPSEVAKWAIVLVLAWYCARRAAVLQSFTRGLGPALIGLGLIIAVIAKEDLGTAALIAVVSCVVLIAAGARIPHFLAFSPVMIAGAFAAIWLAPYRIRRLISFLQPYDDPMGDGYHIIQSLLAISGGDGAGRGLGYGLQKLGYLPEDRTDFLFAVICEELGIGGGILVVFLLCALVWTALGIARNQTVPALKLIALGVASTIAFQTLINLFVVTGLAPTKGIALPLISFGGTGWILTCASLGLLIAIDRHSRADASILSREEAPTHARDGHGLAVA